jgi:hypothetical protein
MKSMMLILFPQLLQVLQHATNVQQGRIPAV